MQAPDRAAFAKADRAGEPAAVAVERDDQRTVEAAGEVAGRRVRRVMLAALQLAEQIAGGELAGQLRIPLRVIGDGLPRPSGRAIERATACAVTGVAPASR